MLMTNKNKIMDNIGGFIKQFLAFDKEGLVRGNMAELAYFTYRSMLKESGRDYVEGEINQFYVTGCGFAATGDGGGAVYPPDDNDVPYNELGFNHSSVS